jgi:hypothetical protein
LAGHFGLYILFPAWWAIDQKALKFTGRRLDNASNGA